MISNNINLNHLRIFETVYRLKSMTFAASELHLTQSGISQHISSFEETLNVPLFDRIKQRLVPTSHGHQLYEKASHALKSLDETFSDLNTANRRLVGKVSIGLPIEFGNNVILPLLVKFTKLNPAVKFQLRYDFANVINENLLNGELDFAFVDTFALDQRISTKKVYDEVLELCAHPSLVKKKELSRLRDPKVLVEELEYVEYQPELPLLKLWFKHHYNLTNPRFNARVIAMDVEGIFRLINLGQGAGILPGHRVEKILKEGGKLHVFKGSGKPLRNEISIAHLKDRSQTTVVNATMSWILGELENQIR